MTKSVTFSGKGIDARELTAADLKKAGVEGFTKTLFRKGEVVDVDDEVAEALTGHALFKGFSIVDPKAKTEEVDTEPVDTGSAQESVGPKAPKGSNRSSTP